MSYQSHFLQLFGEFLLKSKLIASGKEKIYGYECCRLRIKDIDFDQQLIIVRDGKGGKDRATLLPTSLNEDLQIQMEKVFALHDLDLAEGYGFVWLPDALDRKYPGAAAQKAWQYLFPSANRSVDPRSGVVRRHHMSDMS